MISIATDYASRMKDADSKSVNGIDLTKESIAIRLDKTTLLNQLNADPSVDGVFVLFALNDGTTDPNCQSVITIPCDANDKAVKTNGKMEGWEMFPKPNPSSALPTMHQIVNDPGGVNAGVTNALKILGIN